MNVRCALFTLGKFLLTTVLSAVSKIKKSEATKKNYTVNKWKYVRIYMLSDKIEKYGWMWVSNVWNRTLAKRLKWTVFEAV